MLNSVAQTARHRPALTSAIGFGLGIAIDHHWHLPIWLWLVLALACILLTLIAMSLPRSARLSSVAIIGLLFCTGAARHHIAWSITPSDDLTKWCSESPQSVAVTGLMVRPIEIHDRPIGPHIPPWMEIDRSVGLLRVENLDVDGTAVPSSGHVRLEVNGHLVGISVGDRVEVLGKLSRPGPPVNPGAVSYAEFLKLQGTNAQLRASHPAAVRKIHSERGVLWTVARWREGIRQECQRLMAAELRPPLRGLASSLLIGDRTELTEELKEQFAETGMMHLIAISGLNVGIMLGIIFFFGRLLNLGFYSSAWGMILAALLFTWITDHQPSVIRAGLLIVLGLLGTMWNRRTDAWNTLAVCALILLVWNPLNLFDIGAQFSFLAVAAIFWSSQVSLKLTYRNLTGIPYERTIWQQRLIDAGWVLAQMYFVTGAIWLATVPLTMATFHLITPVGLLLDLLLVPLATFVLGVGYLFLGIGLIAPWIASWIAIPFYWGLWLMQVSIAWGHQIPFGHLFVPATYWWWLLGFYVLLWLTWFGAATWREWHWGKRILPLWIVLGLLLPLIPTARRPFRCTFLSVGHGLACVIELPNRETILYDAGTLGDGRRAQRAVERLLWTRGIRVIDTIIVSHADHDHFSGLFGLFEKFPIRQLLMSPQSARSTQTGVVDLLQTSITNHVPVNLLTAGDQLSSKMKDITIDVLHPRGTIRGAEDNSHSLVMAVNYAGRRILLTGDLEREGLSEFLRRDDIRCDVMLSPHHGGQEANRPELYVQTDPKWVVMSSGRQHVHAIEETLKGRNVLNTATSGAITFEIDSDGNIRQFEHLN